MGIGAPTSSETSSEKSGSWPTMTGRPGLPASSRIRSSTGRSTISPSRGSRCIGTPSRSADDLRRLAGADQRRRQDHVRARTRPPPAAVPPAPPGAAPSRSAGRSSSSPSQVALSPAWAWRRTTSSIMPPSAPPAGHPSRLVAPTRRPCWRSATSWNGFSRTLISFRTRRKTARRSASRALRRGRVVEPPVDRLAGAGEHGAGFAGLVADRDHVVEVLPEEFGDRLRRGPGDVDADLGQDPDGQRVHALRHASPPRRRRRPDRPGGGGWPPPSGCGPSCPCRRRAPGSERRQAVTG